MARRRRGLFGVLLLIVAVGIFGIARLACGTARPSSRATATPTATTARTAEASPPVGGRRAAITPPVVPAAARGTLRLEGQVIDEDEQPVAGALVALGPLDLQTRAEDDGSFVFEQLRSRRYDLVAARDDLYGLPVSVRLTATTEPVIVRMRRGATAVVRVVDDRGPVAGARVELDDLVETTTDARGIATLRGIAPRFHQLEVSAPGHAEVQKPLRVGDDPAIRVELTITLSRGAPVGGTVLGPDGGPVADATVHVLAAESTRETTATGFSISRTHHETRSDATGAWRLEAIAAGRYRVYAASERYGRADDLPLEVDGATPRTDVVVRVETDGQLVGEVVDARGQPVPDAEVFARTRGGNYRVDSDARGAFEMLGITPAEYRVFARVDTRASEVATIAVADGARASVKLVVQPSSIAGVVVDAAGEPVPEARVTARPAQLDVANFADDLTDSHGRFDLGGLAPGDYLVNARAADDPSRAYGGKDSVTVPAGTTDVKLVLPTPASVTGCAVRDGQPVPYFGVAIAATPDGPWRDPTTIRAADGRFRLRNVPAGTHALAIIAPGSARAVLAQVIVRDGKVTDVGDVALAPGLRITGHVRDGFGVPVAGATVSIGYPFAYRANPVAEWFRGAYQTQTDANGAYDFAGIAPRPEGQRGREIVATHPRHTASIPQPVPVRDGTVELVVGATGGLDGTIAGYTRDFRLVQARHAGGHVAETFLDDMGAFRFDGLPPGDYAVRAVTAGATVTPVEVTVTANTRARVRLVQQAR